MSSMQDLANAGEFTVMQNIMDFDDFVDMFKELNGDEIELRHLKQNFDMNWNGTCDEIIDAITNLPHRTRRLGFILSSQFEWHKQLCCGTKP